MKFEKRHAQAPSAAWKWSTLLAGVVAVWAMITGDNTIPPAPDTVLTVSVEGVDAAQPGELVILKAAGNATKYKWAPQPGLKVHTGCKNKDIAFATTVEGPVHIMLSGTDATGEIESYLHTVMIGKAPPPTPVDPPKPVDPPTPIPMPGKISVLMIEETDDRTPEFGMLQGSWPLRDYLNSHCEKGANNKPLWFFADKDQDVSKLPAMWADAMKQPRTTLPWYVVMGPGGKPILYSGPVPTKSVPGSNGQAKITFPLEDSLNLLQQYGGK